MRHKPITATIRHSFSLLIMYGIYYLFRHYIAILRDHSYCLLRDSQLRSSPQNILDGGVLFSVVVRTLPEDGNVMPKHVGATIHN
jgi:hypothetical protein